MRTDCDVETHSCTQFENETPSPSYPSLSQREVNSEGEERCDQAGAHSHSRQHHRARQDGRTWQVNSSFFET